MLLFISATRGGLFEKVAAWLAEVAGGAVYLPPPAVAGFRPDELMGRAVEVDKLMYAYAPWRPTSMRCRECVVSCTRVS